MKFYNCDTLVNVVVTSCTIQGTNKFDSTGRAVINFDVYYDDKFVMTNEFRGTYVSSKLQDYVRNTLNGKRTIYWTHGELGDEAENNQRYNSIIYDLNNIRTSKTPNQDISILIEKIRDFIVPEKLLD